MSDQSYVYINSEPGLWTVGFYQPSGKWEAESDHSSTEGAAARVHYLNGGTDTANGGLKPKEGVLANDGFQ